MSVNKSLKHFQYSYVNHHILLTLTILLLRQFCLPPVTSKPHIAQSAAISVSMASTTCSMRNAYSHVTLVVWEHLWSRKCLIVMKPTVHCMFYVFATCSCPEHLCDKCMLIFHKCWTFRWMKDRPLQLYVDNICIVVGA